MLIPHLPRSLLKLPSEFFDATAMPRNLVLGEDPGEGAG
jgi:hypothetical protein